MKKRELDISNYEAWMLDQMEGQLSAEEEMQLRDFLIAHPELDDDMDSLAEFSLSPESILHPDRESLKMPEKNDMLLISALESGSDGSEFSGEELKEFERYQKTIILADERIIYPNKESLRKKEWTPIIPMWLGRLAIAASLIGIVLTLFFQTSPETYEPRLTESDLPVIDLNFPDSSSEHYAEQEVETNPAVAPAIIETPLENLAQEEKPESDESRPKPSPLYAPQEAPQVDFAESPEIELEENSLEIESPELDIAESPIIDEDSISAPEEPLIAEEPEVAVIGEEPLVAEVPEVKQQKSQVVTASNTREFGSVLDLLKHATRDSDLLAIQDVKEESAYVETSLKVGRFQLDVKRRKKN